MKSGKRVIGVMIVSLLLITSIGLVSAGLKDWFGFGDDNKDLEGELATETVARLSISDTSVPNITFVSNVTSNSGADIASDIIKLKPKSGNGETLVSFWFMAQQGAAGDSPGDLILGGTTSRAYLTFPGELIRFNTSCVAVGVANCDGLYCGAGETAMNYSCTVPMKYYDINGTWSINVSVKTATGGYGYNTTETFKISQTYAAYAHTKELNWTNNPLNTGSVNVYSDNNITVENNGNVPYFNVRVNATILNGTGSIPGQKAEYIPTNRFNAYSCINNPGVSLQTDTFVLVDKFVAPRATDDSGKNSSLPFCVTSLAATPNGLSTQIYNSSRAWVLDLS